jgi:hypothetical protein
MRAQLRGSACARRPARAAAAAAAAAPRRAHASASPADADAHAPPPAHAPPRRTLLAAAAGACFAALAAPQRAAANPFDDFLAAKRRTNAKFLVGPIVLARLRLKAAEALPAEEARTARARSVRALCRHTYMLLLTDLRGWLHARVACVRRL